MPVAKNKGMLEEMGAVRPVQWKNTVIAAIQDTGMIMAHACPKAPPANRVRMSRSTRADIRDIQFINPVAKVCRGILLLIVLLSLGCARWGSLASHFLRDDRHRSRRCIALEFGSKIVGSANLGRETKPFALGCQLRYFQIG